MSGPDGPEQEDEVRLFLWDGGISDHIVYRSLVRSIDTLGGAGGQHPRLDLSYSVGGVDTNENNVRNLEAYTDFNAITFWRNTHAKQIRTQSLPYASWDRADTYEGRVVWVYVQSLSAWRKAIIMDQRAAPGNRIDVFYINPAASSRVTLNNIKAYEDADQETENYWHRRRLSRGNI